MTSYVVDASIAVKWFVPEIHSEDALRFLDDRNTLHAPELLLPEMGNILWKKLRMGELTVNEGREILRKLNVMPIRVHPATTLLEPAFEIAAATQRSVYDSFYVALAVVCECQLVTADAKLYNALKGGPFKPNLLWVSERI